MFLWLLQLDRLKSTHHDFKAWSLWLGHGVLWGQSFIGRSIGLHDLSWWGDWRSSWRRGRRCRRFWGSVWAAKSSSTSSSTRSTRTWTLMCWRREEHEEGWRLLCLRSLNMTVRRRLRRIKERRTRRMCRGRGAYSWGGAPRIERGTERRRKDGRRSASRSRRWWNGRKSRRVERGSFRLGWARSGTRRSTWRWSTTAWSIRRKRSKSTWRWHAGDQQGHGLQLAMNPPVPPPGHEGDIPNYRAWITPMGTRYHVTTLCATRCNGSFRALGVRYVVIVVVIKGIRVSMWIESEEKLTMIEDAPTRAANDVHGSTQITMDHGRTHDDMQLQEWLGLCYRLENRDAVSQGGVQIVDSLIRTYPWPKIGCGSHFTISPSWAKNWSRKGSKNGSNPPCWDGCQKKY